MSLGARLRAIRKARGLTLRQVEAQSGVSISTLSRAERDMGMPDLVTLVGLEDFYKVSLGSGLGAKSPTDEQVEAFLIGHGYNLEQLRADFNALIDRLREEARSILAEKAIVP